MKAYACALSVGSDVGSKAMLIAFSTYEVVSESGNRAKSGS